MTQHNLHSIACPIGRGQKLLDASRCTCAAKLTWDQLTPDMQNQARAIFGATKLMGDSHDDFLYGLTADSKHIMSRVQISQRTTESNDAS